MALAPSAGHHCRHRYPPVAVAWKALTLTMSSRLVVAAPACPGRQSKASCGLLLRLLARSARRLGLALHLGRMRGVTFQSRCRRSALRARQAAGSRRRVGERLLPAAAEVLGVLLDGVLVRAVGPGRLGDRLPPASVVGEHPQLLWLEHVGVVDRGGAGGVVGQWWAWWFVAVAVAAALVAQILGVVAGAVAGWGGEIAMED
jgi:hypothetical protein